MDPDGRLSNIVIFIIILLDFRITVKEVPLTPGPEAVSIVARQLE